MERFTLQQFADQVASLGAAVIALWIGLAALTIALFILSRTRWGQERPLRKCLLLSVLAHVLFIGYATTVRIVAGLPVRDPEPIVHISLDEGNPLQTSKSDAGAQNPSPWASHHDVPPAYVDSLEPERVDSVGEDDLKQHSRADQLGTSPLSPMDRVAMVDPVQPEPDSPPPVPIENDASLSEEAAPIDAPTPKRRDAQPTQVPDAISSRPQISDLPVKEPAKQTPVDGIATSLLMQHVPLPRLSNVPLSVEPNPVLAGPTDASTATGHGQPARLEDSVAPGSMADPSDLHPSTDAAIAPAETASPAEAIAAAVPKVGEFSDPIAGANDIGPPVLGQARRRRTQQDVPRVYRLRVAPNRSELALRYGATEETEAAVRAALKWLADNQERDGRWAPARHSGGSERRVLGRDRFGAGARADTGISALAMLAFLASGHTHEEGVYRENVRRGLEFLLRSQGTDGNLGGQASTYAMMYCHAMATFAMSEAYGMTGDRRLEGPVRRAIMYTVTAQNPSTGGWRYNIGDEGDTSQLGWQLMALKSADLAGIPMPAHTRQGAIRYLDSVSSGRFGGLAAYRPVEAPSRPMTAEALACRFFLGIPPNSLTSGEATEYLLAELPGDEDANFYYWYYATLGVYQTQGEAWERWNTALQRELLARQQKSGNLAGSWDPDTVWGGYGGRVYTTSLATLCLEVYYRFMPLYVEAAAAGRTLR